MGGFVTKHRFFLCALLIAFGLLAPAIIQADVSVDGGLGSTGSSGSRNIGTAGTDRVVIIYAMSEADSAISLSNATVDGKSCNHVVTAYNTNGAGNRTELWYCDEDDLGSSNGTVTVAISGTGITSANWAIHTQLFTNASQSGPTDFGINNTAVSTDSVPVTGIDVPAGGAVSMGASNGGGALTASSYTSPLSQLSSADPASADAVGAAGVETSAQTGKTYTLTWSGSANRSSAIVSSWDEPVSAPTVSSSAASGVGVTSATLNGNISATGGANATVRGFAWGTDSALSTNVATTVENGSFGTGTFSDIVSGLFAGVTYYFRAYATNSGGTGYGSILNFTAGSDPGPPAPGAARRTRLFEGFVMKLLSGRIVIYEG